MVSYDENDPVIAKVADFGLARSVAPKIAGALGTWQVGTLLIFLFS